MFLSNCFCLQVAQPADEQPERRPGQPASVAPPSNDATAARPAQASRCKSTTTRDAPPPNDVSTRKGVTFSVPKPGKVEPQSSPQPGLEPQTSGRTAACLGASAAKSSSRPTTASSDATWATSVGTLSAGSAVSRYCFSEAEETDVTEAEADVDDGNDGCRPSRGCGRNPRRSRSRSRSCSRSRNSSRRSAVTQGQSDDGDDDDEDEEEDGDGDDGYVPDDDDDNADSQDGVDSRAASCKTAKRAGAGAPARSVAERTRSNASTWSVKVMTQLQLLPDQDGRLRLPSILAFTHRRPPREARTQAWWTKVKGVLVVAGQSITAGGSSLRRSLRRRGTGGDSLRTRTACQSGSQSLAADTDTENESYAYDGYGFADSPAAAAGGVSPAAAAVKPAVPSAPSAAVVAVGTAAVTSKAAAVAERCSTPGCDVGPSPPQGAGAQPASKAGARPNQERAGVAGPAEATPGSSWQPHWLPPLTVIDAEGGGRGTGQRSLRPSAPGPACARTNREPAAAAGAPHGPGSPLRPRSHPQLQVPHQPQHQPQPQPQPQMEQALPWPQEPPLTRTATMDFRRASGWGPDTQQHPAGMPGGPLYGAGGAGGGGGAGGAERPSRSGRRTCSGGRTSGSGGRSPHTGLSAGSGGDRDWGPVDEESGWGACNCSLPGQLHSPCIPVG